MLLEAVKTLLGWVILMPGCYLVGAAFGRFLTEEDFRLRGIFYMALGFMALSLYLTAAGSVGQLNRGVILFFFAAVFIFQKSQLGSFGRWFGAILRYPWAGKGWFERVLAVVFYNTLILTFLFCLLPETANDALCYQLNIPKEFIRQGSIWPVAYDANSYMPLAMNLLYAAGLLFKSIGITKLFHAVMALLLTYTIAFKVEHLTGSARVARFTALMFWLAPVIVNEVTTAHVDVGVAFFLMVAFLWLYAAIQQEKRGLALIAGLGAGMMIAVKFSLLISMPVLVLVGFNRWLRPLQLKKIIGYGLLFSVGTFLGCGYWFTRNYILKGNPTFPYFGEVFHTIGVTSYGTYLDMGVAKTLWNFILLPAYLTLHPVPFDQHYWVGPYMLLSVPTFILSYGLPRARPYFFFTLLLGGAWFLTTQATRYLVPVLAFWYIAAGAGLPFLIARIKQWKVGGFVSLGVFALTGFLLLGNAYHYRVQFQALVGGWSSDGYLRKVERSYPAAAWVDKNLPQDARILNVEEVRQFYFNRPTVREEFLSFFTRYSESRETQEVLRFLKEQGFTHIMVMDDPAQGGGVRPARLAWLAEAIARPEWLQPLGAVKSENIRDAKWTYSFYRIQ